MYDTEAYMKILKNTLSSRRFYHSLCVSQSAKKLAERYNQDVEKAKEAVKGDDVINHQEKNIENLCLKLLLQRIGDHAADISEITIALASQPYVKKLEHIQEMAKETMQMIVKAVDAFVEKDKEKAIAVMQQDDVVDDLFDTVKKELIGLIHENPENGEQAADLLMVAKYFERIGDHATNISEWVVFSITGIHKELNEEIEE